MASVESILPEQEEEFMALWSYYQENWVEFIKDVLQVELEPKQAEMVTAIQNNERVAARTCHGAGKALSLDTLLATPTGWTTMGEVQVGDILFNEYGLTTKVIYVAPIEHRDTYKVEFDDGSTVIASDVHDWQVMSLNERNKERAKLKRKNQTIQDWREHWHISEKKDSITLKNALKTECGQFRWGIPTAMSLISECAPKISPYVLGAWLGDGTTIYGTITVGHEDIPEIKELFEKEGYPLRVQPASINAGCAMYNIASLATELRVEGILGDKHIPQTYLRADIDSRLELLRGLMDADGFVMGSGKSVGIDLTCKKLFDGVIELINSLGWKTYVTTNQGQCNGKISKLVYRCNFSPDICVFKLARKKTSWEQQASNGMASRHTIRTIVNIEKIETVPTRCIMVDSPTHIYLAGRSMIPTHNTFVAACVALTVMSLYPYAQVVSTAPTNRQVEVLLWNEIGRRYNSSLLPDLGFPAPLNKMWKIAPGWMAVGASSDEGVRLEGFHSPTIIVYLIDEAKGVADKIFESLKGGQNAPISRIFLFSTPGPSAGEFYEATEGKKKHLYKQVHVSGYDVPRPEHQKWMADMKAEYGEDSPIFIMRCLGQYADESSCKIFTQRILRMLEENAMNLQPEGKRIMGVDVARMGADSSVFSYRVGPIMIRQEEYRDKRIDQTAELLEKEARSFNAESIVIDSIGIGAGVADILIGKSMGHKVERFMTRQKAECEDYANRKTEVGAMLTPELKRDLENYDYTIVAKGQNEQYIIVDPDDSPDFGDSFLLAFAVDDSSGACVGREAKPATEAQKSQFRPPRLSTSREPMLSGAARGQMSDRFRDRYLIRRGW